MFTDVGQAGSAFHARTACPPDLRHGAGAPFDGFGDLTVGHAPAKTENHLDGLDSIVTDFENRFQALSKRGKRGSGAAVWCPGAKALPHARDSSPRRFSGNPR